MSFNSCSNITLPGVAGPAGAVGAQGIQGIQGDIGADGTTVLEVDFTEYIEDQNTFSVVSKSFNIPADSWEVNNDIVELEAIFVTENTTSGYYQVRVELGTNIVALMPTWNDVYITSKSNFLNLKVQLVLSASGEVTPITESATSPGAWYSINWAYEKLSTSIYRGPQITGLNTAAIIPLKVYLVSSVTGKNIKMFYYKLTSLKK
tara:strand:- start:393 stop:1007 length:615 start_codon:yes stop_codon:yes gene_type:complete